MWHGLWPEERMGDRMENGILHVDMNNFYASVETLYAPEYRNVPMAVAGDKESRHGIILAKICWRNAMA